MATARAKSKRLQERQPQAQERDAPMVIPVIQEEVTIEKQVVETGRVRISKRISEHEELVDVPLLREEVTIERVPVNLIVAERPPVRQEGDTMIIPVVKEEIVIQKKLLLVEELRVRKQIIEAHQPQTVNLLKEEVEIKRVAKSDKFNASRKKG